jgi:hypothetical protein
VCRGPLGPLAGLGIVELQRTRVGAGLHAGHSEAECGHELSRSPSHPGTPNRKGGDGMPARQGNAVEAMVLNVSGGT